MDKHLRNAPFRFEPADWFVFFEKAGWRCKEIRYTVEEAERLKRRPPMSVLLVFGFLLRSLFMSKAQRETARRSMGVALLEPLGR